MSSFEQRRRAILNAIAVDQETTLYRPWQAETVRLPAIRQTPVPRLAVPIDWPWLIETRPVPINGQREQVWA